MDLALPKRIFKHGHEPQVDKINNSCKTSFLKTLETLLPEEYAEVKSDPLFTHIMAISDSSMGYSTEKISLMSAKLQYLQQYHKWSHVDMIKLIYLTVITSVLMANDEKIHISHKYIKLVMDIEKLRMYPWGLESKKLKNKTSYVLDEFTYAFHIWIMEAISDFGKMLGKKKDKEFIGPRCENWIGAAKISYKHIIQLESLFESRCTLHPNISASRYEGMLLDVAFLRDDELTGERVDYMLELITKHHKWTTSMWGFDKSIVTFLEEDGDIDIDLSDGPQV
ncbi:hypothetical protein N665_0051s0015 [Sinapis alba]|nr:hypothetical protein N665_0051s0015 [Sinapis alba]